MATAIRTRRPVTKWKLGPAKAGNAYSSMSCKYLAREVQMIHFPKEGKWVETPNLWRLGWDPSLKAWVAANTRSCGWRFKNLAGLQAFRSFLEGKDWEVTRV